MSSGTTLNYSIPYPIPTDPVNITNDIEALAVRIDNILKEEIEDTSASMWTGGTFTNGIQTPTYNDSTGKMSMSLAQDIQVSASPTFVNIELTGDIAINGGNITTTSGQIDVSEHINIASGKSYEIDNVIVLDSTTLGSSVINSSLESLGTVTSGTWNATEISPENGGTGITSYATGDMIYASSSATIEKLGIGSANYVMTSDGSQPVWTQNSGTGYVVRNDSPSFLGIPTSTTASVDSSTSQIATTEFVINQSYLKVADAASTYSTISNPIFTGSISSEGTDITFISSASAGTEDFYLTVERGSDPDVSIRWNELGDAWQFTNDGSTYFDIPTAAGGGTGLEGALFLGGM